VIVLDVWDKKNCLQQHARYVVPEQEAFLLAKNEIESGNIVHMKAQDEQSPAVNFDSRFGNDPTPEPDMVDIGCLVIRERCDADLSFVATVKIDGDLMHVASRYVMKDETELTSTAGLNLIVGSIAKVMREGSDK